MDNAKVNVYKKVLQEVCEKLMVLKSLLKIKLKRFLSWWKIISGRGNLFLFERLGQVLKLKGVVLGKVLQASFKCSVTTLIFFYKNSMA